MCLLDACRRGADACLVEQTETRRTSSRSTTSSRFVAFTAVGLELTFPPDRRVQRAHSTAVHPRSLLRLARVPHLPRHRSRRHRRRWLHGPAALAQLHAPLPRLPLVGPPPRRLQGPNRSDQPPQSLRRNSSSRSGHVLQTTGRGGDPPRGDQVGHGARSERRQCVLSSLSRWSSL